MMDKRRVESAWLRGSVVAGLLAVAVSAQSAQPAPSKLSLGVVDGEEHITVTVEGESVKISANGRELADERVTRNGSRLTIKDVQGRPLAVVTLPGSGHGVIRTLPRSRPRLHLGVSASPPSDGLCQHLNLEQDEALYVSAVPEDGPAAAAGVEVHDVLVSLDGAPATMERLRQLLEDREAGDVIPVRLVRRGAEQEVEIELKAMSHQHLVGTAWSVDPWKAADLYSSKLQDYWSANVDFDTALNHAKINTGYLFDPDATGRYLAPWGAPTITPYTDPKTSALNEPEPTLEEQIIRLEERLAKIQELLETRAERK